MCSSCARVSLMSVSLPKPTGSYLSSNTPVRWTVKVRRFCGTRADAFRKYCAVSSSFVRNSMFVFGAEDTSSLKPRPTVRSCGSGAPRRLQDLGKVRVSKGRKLVENDADHRPVLAAALLLVLVTLANHQLHVLQQHPAKGRDRF